MYKQAIFPLLSRVDPEQTHDWTLDWLQRAQRIAVGRLVLRFLTGSVPHQPVEVFGLTFPNVLGVAAGFDKDARVTSGLALLGFGHVEVGTLTPRPQIGNPKPRIFRLRADNALINRMGFPNEGVEAAKARLQLVAQQKQRCVVGVSLGKQKETPLAEAAEDYIRVMRAIYPSADYLVVNISSPNTPGLRELQNRDDLGELLKTVMEENTSIASTLKTRKRPLLVKVAPELTWSEMDDILTAVMDNDLNGIIATNTTIERAGLIDLTRDEPGGLSGEPLSNRSTEMIAYISRHTNGQLPVIGVGGIRTAEDAKVKIDAGASLVQLYTGMVYEGPRIAGQILRGLDSEV